MSGRGGFFLVLTGLVLLLVEFTSAQDGRLFVSKSYGHVSYISDVSVVKILQGSLFPIGNDHSNNSYISSTKSIIF